MNKIIDMGNNESLAIGIFPQRDGTFTALTSYKSKTFKTLAGAQRWITRQGVDLNDLNDD